ncbi:hypothetical protein [Hazenella coriacea]|uniref:Protease stability complex PrcB-like protein n=1 Tax=Hazenella coriacea TaxID=1179467 RepID=A0A4R3LAB5_9BACL|nr:hypothetical protein [Hazenella coriacea]TCS96679.1 hypothetical protein EDD58_101315 [Hazenella coriacea]
MRIFIWSIALYLMMFLVTGCSTEEDTPEKEKGQAKPTTVQSETPEDAKGTTNQSNTQVDENETKPPQSAKPDEPLPKPKEKKLLKFKQVSANYYNVPAQSTSGVWFYTKEAHPGSINRYANWDREDLVYIQFADREYYGYNMAILSVEPIDSSKVQVLVRPSKDRLFQYDQPARIILTVPKGSLNSNIQFQVETEGKTEKLQLQ